MTPTGVWSHAYATWRVLRRLRRSAERRAQPRSYTRHARANISAAVALLDWLAERDTTLAETGQVDIDTWLTGGLGPLPGARLPALGRQRRPRPPARRPHPRPHPGQVRQRRTTAGH